MKEFYLIGVPTSSGALYSGTDLAPQAFRQSNLSEYLTQKGFTVRDLGDIKIPSCMPKHNVPPIRNWPAPRMVWESIIDCSDKWLHNEKRTLIMGGDCSILVGTLSAFSQKYKEDAYLLVLDAHIDNVGPVAHQCVGAAAMGLWFLSRQNPHWEHVPLKSEQIMVIGFDGEENEDQNLSAIALTKLRQDGIKETVDHYLSSLPKTAKILLHIDVDVIDEKEMKASYGPAKNGLLLSEMKELLKELLKDPRIGIIEVTEFSGLKDHTGTEALKITKLLADVL